MCGWRSGREPEQIEACLAFLCDEPDGARARNAPNLPQIQHVVRTNYCDLGFELGKDGKRLVLVSCLDNLLKGAVGPGGAEHEPDVRLGRSGGPEVRYVVKLGGASIEDKALLHACGKAIAELGARRQPGCAGAWRRQAVDGDAGADGQEERVCLRPARYRCGDARCGADGAGRAREQVAGGGAAHAWAVGDGTGRRRRQRFRARKKKTIPDLGFVGEIAATDPLWLEAIWKMDAVPVISSIALGFDGEYYNINADEMAAACAICTKADALVFLTDVPGVKGADGEGDALALAEQIPELEQADGGFRRHAAEAECVPRSADSWREARTHSAGGGGASTYPTCARPR